jgi:hypothetical protein
MITLEEGCRAGCVCGSCGEGQGWFHVNVGGFGSLSRLDWLFAAVAGVCPPAVLLSGSP